jgi:predicted NBD/HSP70 family sugar kinase
MSYWAGFKTIEMVEDNMSEKMGVDVGGTSVDYVVASNTGDFLHEKSYCSPFKKTGNLLDNGEAEVLVDTIPELQDYPVTERVLRYLGQKESEFLNEVGTKITSKGYSLCGKTWSQNGSIYMMGGNTPSRLATNLDNGRVGILVAELPTSNSGYESMEFANDGNAAATAQGIYYQAKKRINTSETGYFILGTGFGFGVPKSSALTEIGHIPVGFVPSLLWQTCGCTNGHTTACAENFVSGRGIKSCAELLLSLNPRELRGLLNSMSESIMEDLDIELILHSGMSGDVITSEMVMNRAHERSDHLAILIANMAAEVTAYAAVTAAQLFGLQRIGIGESVALSNPWHVENISRRVNSYTSGNNILSPSLIVELTPIKNPAKFGALSLVVPESQYEGWAEKMEKD